MWGVKIVIVIVVTFLTLVVLEYVVWKNTNLHRSRNPSLYEGISFEYPQVEDVERERIKRGYARAASRRIVVIGLAKDIRDRIELNVNRALHLGGFFRDYRVVVFENDSTDGTRDWLIQKRADDPHVELAHCCDLGQCQCRLRAKSAVKDGYTSKRRIQKMAEYRNVLLDHVRTVHPDFDFIMVLDLDAEGPFSVDGVMHSLSFDDWDVIASNGQSPLPGTLGSVATTYDAFAYAETIEEGKRSLYRDFVQQHYRVKTAKGLLPVQSAFNGAALYRLASIGDARYEDVMGCEHIGLHRNMGTKRIFINPFWKWYVGIQGPRDWTVFVPSGERGE